MQTRGAKATHGVYMYSVARGCRYESNNRRGLSCSLHMHSRFQVALLNSSTSIPKDDHVTAACILTWNLARGNTTALSGTAILESTVYPTVIVDASFMGRMALVDSWGWR